VVFYTVYAIMLKIQ